MKIKASPNVVPLCDILLVLLIIFMVITPAMQAGVDVNMPEGTGPGSGTVVITVEKEGVVRLNNETYRNYETFEKRLKEIFDTRLSNKTVFVQAHEKVPYKDVIRVMDSAKGVGVTTICAMTRKIRN
jgi:biopolymer transport protein ExbD